MLRAYRYHLSAQNTHEQRFQVTKDEPESFSRRTLRDPIDRVKEEHVSLTQGPKLSPNHEDPTTPAPEQPSNHLPASPAFESRTFLP